MSMLYWSLSGKCFCVMMLAEKGIRVTRRKEEAEPNSSLVMYEEAPLVLYLFNRFKLNTAGRNVFPRVAG